MDGPPPLRRARMHHPRSSPRRALMSLRPPGLLVLFLVGLVIAGCKTVDMTSWFRSENETRDQNVRSALRGSDGHPRRIGDYVAIVGLQPRRITGVGLVVGLRGTGEDPPASGYRTALLDDMRRRGVQNPNEVLQDRSTALVLVTGYVPPLIRKGDRIDVSVQLPPGSQVESLAGGKLIECQLIEHGFVEGAGVLQGDSLARAQGFVLVSSRESGPGVAGQQKGVIPGGGVYTGDDQNLALYLRNDYRGPRMSDRIARRIGERFHGYDHTGHRRPLAEAMTDARVRLTLDPHYRDYPDRYMRVIREIRLVESSVDQHLRMQDLRERLMSGPTAAQAALELEAIGNDAVPVLKEGLNAPSQEARFYAAEALAYLGRTDGVATLAEAADKEPAFRVFALAAMASLKETQSVLALRELLKHQSIETRAGAWRALTMINRDDHSIPNLLLNDQFRLYVVDSPTPMIHLTRTKHAEIAIFHAEQRLLPPMLLSAGPDIMVRAEAGARTAMISRISLNQPPQQIEVPLNVESVIRGVASLGATYPDVVQLLVEAEKQFNLEGPVAIDEYPQAGRVYQRPDDESALIPLPFSADAAPAAELPSLFEGHPEELLEPSLPTLDEFMTDEIRQGSSDRTARTDDVSRSDSPHESSTPIEPSSTIADPRSD